MRRTTMITLALALATPLAGAQTPDDTYEIPEQTLSTARALAEKALDSELALEVVTSLTTQIGPRLAGTDAEARAREWGADTLRALGFANVRVEEFALDVWTRGDSVHEELSIVSPYPQPLFASSLGGGGATPPEGLEASITYFDSYDDFVRTEPAAVKGRAVYINDRMTASRTGEGYGWANRKRRSAWHAAEDMGAAAVLVRSVGTDSHRFPHTGLVGLPEGRKPKIPVLAVSAPDADQLERIHGEGADIAVRIKTPAGWRGEGVSGNVIGEIVGREKPEEIVVIGGHLDSWDLGTGALDDGAGVAITVAAARLISELPQAPKRTIRVVMFGAEEVGILGARAYASARQLDGTLQNHVLGSESDFGARKVWRLRSDVGPDALPAVAAMGRELSRLGVIPGDNDGNGGPDMIPLR
ncbi:MAG: M20/M25/M40 family metallo-hydrolase, partial [Pseudomonadota bacterium]